MPCCRHHLPARRRWFLAFLSVVVLALILLVWEMLCRRAEVRIEAFRYRRFCDTRAWMTGPRAAYSERTIVFDQRNRTM